MRYETSIFHECGALNSSLRRRVLQLPENKIVRKSHYLGGRYENLYISLGELPEIRTILEVAVVEASRILAFPQEELRIGWWLNVMHPGDVTHAHTHDDDEELLSGVYYVDVPVHSGCLVLVDGASREQIEAKGVCLYSSHPICSTKLPITDPIVRAFPLVLILGGWKSHNLKCAGLAPIIPRQRGGAIHWPVRKIVCPRAKCST